ncbi:MAG TPA: ABC transporter permease [Longimicrobiales bacterium]|nr:ABC transporter permease [Longimicrobiales bacterium]
MDRWRGLLRRLRAVFARGSAARELDEELRLHVQLETEAGVRRGLSEGAARRAALVAFGGEDRFREEARDASGLTLLEQLGQDARVALRMLRRNPQFASAVVLTLALGIGANTAIFSVVDAVLLQPTPHAEPERLVMVWQTDRDSETRHEPASWPDLVDLRERSRTLAGLGAMSAGAVTLIGGSEPERVSALAVTPDLPGVLGVTPLLGRTFVTGEGAAGGPKAALLGESYWRRRFGADPAVLGRRVVLDGEPATIVGVLPDGADLGLAQVHARADYSAPMASSDVEVWLALEPSAEAFPRETHPFLVIGRLAPGATVASAQAELAEIMAELETAYPENQARGANVERYGDVTFGGVRPALRLLILAVALVLLVACVNVANLLLARGAVRAREVAVRRALGASTARITRQYLVESAVLTATGAAVGVALAWGGLRLLVALAPADIPRLTAAAIDLRVLGFTAAVAILVSFAFALLPVLHARRLDLQSVLKLQAGRRVSTGRGGRRVQRALVIAEVALAVPLVIGAGVLLRSFQALSAVDPGFRTEQVLKVQYQLPASRYPMDFSQWPNLSAINAFHADLLSRVRALPGVTAATLAARHPLDPGFTNSFQIAGREAESAHWPEIRCRFIAPGYLETMGVRLLAGRALAETDVAGTTPVAVVNRAAAERYLAGFEPVGQVIRFWGVPWQIVGVIGDEHFNGVDAATEPAVYTPLAQAPQRAAALLVRTATAPTQLTPAIRRVVRELDPEVALFGVEPLDRTLAASIARPRFTTTLLALFGALAIALALVGVYGVLSYGATQRTAEMGIRMALGASRADVVRLVAGEGARLAAAGAALGVLAALAGSRFLASLVFGVSARDATSFTLVTVAVLLMAAIASWLPARRAARADPALALRSD